MATSTYVLMYVQHSLELLDSRKTPPVQVVEDHDQRRWSYVRREAVSIIHAFPQHFKHASQKVMVFAKGKTLILMQLWKWPAGSGVMCVDTRDDGWSKHLDFQSISSLKMRRFHEYAWISSKGSQCSAVVKKKEEVTSDGISHLCLWADQ